MNTDCSKCIYKYNIKPFHADDKGYSVNGMRMDYREGDNKDNITRDRCSLGLRMSRPICPLFDDGKEVKVRIPKSCDGCPNIEQFRNDGYCKLDGDEQMCPARRLKGSPWIDLEAKQ